MKRPRTPRHHLSRHRRRATVAASLRDMLAHHAQQIAAQAKREGRAVSYWDTIPGIPSEVVSDRQRALWAIEASPFGISQSERDWAVRS